MATWMTRFIGVSQRALAQTCFWALCQILFFLVFLGIPGALLGAPIWGRQRGVTLIWSDFPVFFRLFRCFPCFREYADLFRFAPFSSDLLSEQIRTNQGNPLLPTPFANPDLCRGKGAPATAPLHDLRVTSHVLHRDVSLGWHQVRFFGIIFGHS